MKQLKITVFGDSMAKGLKIENGKPVKLKANVVDILSEKFGLKIENLSYFGQTITRLKEKKIVENYLANLDKKHKNIAVFCIGGNDSDFDWSEVNKTPNELHNAKTPLDIFVKTYTEIITQLKKKKVRVYICGLPPVSAELFFENYICRFGERQNFLDYFSGDISNIVRHQEIYHNSLKQLAHDTNSVFLDIRRPLLEVRNLPFFFAEDGLHPNEEGHKIIAEYLILQFSKHKFA